MIRNILFASLAWASPVIVVSELPARLVQPIQDKAALRKDFAERLARIDEKDEKYVDKLFALALWAERKHLVAESHRLMRKVLVLDPDHAASRKALGYVKLDDKWVLADDVDKLRKKAAQEKLRREEAEYRRKGYIRYAGAWIKKTDLAYAKLGLVRHEGRWIRRSDKDALDAGKVHHPETGRWIAKQDLPRAAKGNFPLGDEEWGPLDRANAFHGSWDTPWEIWTDNLIVETTLPLETAEQIGREGETALAYARGILFDPTLPLPTRVRVRAFPDAASYREFGAASDVTGFSAYGCFYASEVDGKPVAFNWGQKGWGPYYLKHAVALGAAAALMCPQGIEPTSWVLTGIGSYVERWSNSKAAAHFGKQYLQKGGVRGLKSFPKQFQISGDQTPAEMERNIYQAGIVISYLATSPDPRTRKAWDKVRDAIRKGKGLPRAVKAFAKQAARVEQRIRDHLKKCVSS